MALVDYASSDEDADEALVNDTQLPKTTSKGPLKRKRDNEDPEELPPLPSKFHDLYASTTRVSTRDDPSLHGGRKRVTPHVEGNWPTHIYIEWYPATTEHGSLSQLISTLKEERTPRESAKIHSFLTSDLGAPLPLHVSLSRPIGFATEQKDGFLASLEHDIKASGIRPFDFLFSDLDWVPNFEKTRWFLVLRLSHPTGNGLNKLLHVNNKVVQEYGQPPLYAQGIQEKTPQKGSIRGAKKQRRGSDIKVDWTGMQDLSNSFHISIAWTLESPSQELVDATRAAASDQLETIRGIPVKVEEIKVKIGNVVTNIRLQKNVVEGKSLFGF